MLNGFYPAADNLAAEKVLDSPVVAREEILTAYLGTEARGELAAWRLECGDLDPRMTFGEFLAWLETWGWARSVLAEDPAALRVRELLAPWQEVPLAELLAHPVLEAWWYTARDGLGLDIPIRRRPLVTMAAAGQVSGPAVTAGVYLCLGTELPRQHYQVLSRMTENVLILYKEQSPLATPAAE